MPSRDWGKYRAAARGGLRALPFLLIAALLWWLIVDSETLQACVNSPDRAQAYKALHEKLAVLHLSIRVWRHCLFGLANRVSNGITALATAVVAAFTITLWQVSRNQHSASMAALKLANAEFVSTHRPRIRVRSVHATKLDLPNQRHWQIQITFSNVGDTVAIIETASFNVMIREAETFRLIESDIEFFDPQPPDFDPRMESGDRRWGIIRWVFRTNEPEYDAVVRGEHKFAVTGAITYRDANKVLRATGLEWIWNPMTDRFKPTGDATDNYED